MMGRKKDIGERGTQGVMSQSDHAARLKRLKSLGRFKSSLFTHRLIVST